MYLKKTRTGDKLRYVTEERNTDTKVQDRADKKVETSRGSVVPLFYCGTKEKCQGGGTHLHFRKH